MHLLSTDLGHMLRDAGVDVTVLPVDVGQQLAEVTRVHLGRRRQFFHLALHLHPGDLLYRRLLLDDVDNLYLFHLH